MSSRVEQARDRNLSRNLVAAVAHVCTRRHTLDTPWMLEVSAVSIRCPRAGLHCYTRQISLFSGFHDSLFLTLLKSDRWHPQGYWCFNGDDENDVLGADCGALNTDGGLGDSGRRAGLSGLSKKAVPFYEAPPLRLHILVRLVGILQ